MSNTKGITLGVIGYGFRARHMTALMRARDNVRLSSICDTALDKAKIDAEKCEPNFKDIRFFDSAEALLDGPKIDGVLIGTNCSSHAHLAIKVLERKVCFKGPTELDRLRCDRSSGKGGCTFTNT